MKLIKTTTLTFLFITAYSSNASVTITSSNLVGYDDTTSPIVDNTGVAIAFGTGVISVGTFGSLSNSDIQSLNSSSAIAGSFSDLGGFSFNYADGLYSSGFSSDVDDATFDGQSIYTVIGNGDTIASSSQFLVFDHLAEFVIDGQSTSANESAVVGVGFGDLIVGEYDTFTNDFGVGEVSAYSLVTVVPEPSSSALLAIAGVGFILRRRR